MAQKTEPGQLRHMRQVNVGVLHLTGVDLLAHRRVGLVGQAHFDGVGFGQHAIEFGRGRGTRPQADAELFSGGVQFFDAFGQRQRHGFGVARAGKTAHADIGTGGNQGSGLVGGHDFGLQGNVLHAVGEGHQGNSSWEMDSAAARGSKKEES